jgi:hypothetical protein
MDNEGNNGYRAKIKPARNATTAVNKPNRPPNNTGFRLERLEQWRALAICQDRLLQYLDALHQRLVFHDHGHRPAVGSLWHLLKCRLELPLQALSDQRFHAGQIHPTGLKRAVR